MAVVVEPSGILHPSIILLLITSCTWRTRPAAAYHSQSLPCPAHQIELTHFLWTSQTILDDSSPSGACLLYEWIQIERGRQEEATTGTFAPALSFSHTSQLHAWSFCPHALRYPLAVLWPPSAQDVIDVKQDEEKTKCSWTTEQCGCALERAIKHHEESGFIASYWFIIKYALSINSLFQLSLPSAASWLMQLHRCKWKHHLACRKAIMNKDSSRFVRC